MVHRLESAFVSTSARFETAEKLIEMFTNIYWNGTEQLKNTEMLSSKIAGSISTARAFTSDTNSNISLTS